MNVTIKIEIEEDFAQAEVRCQGTPRRLFSEENYSELMSAVYEYIQEMLAIHGGAKE